MTQPSIPQIAVGILSDIVIYFELSGKYKIGKNNYKNVKGSATITEKKMQIKIGEDTMFFSEEAYFSAQNSTSNITLHNVVIGVDFHWERKENQSFKGDLKLLIAEEKICAINVLSLEEYLESVISSEMSATASDALLKAHAVISRSWLLAQLMRKKNLAQGYSSMKETEEELVRWYDREDHGLFDVCADDHCQRYQGITRIGTKRAVEAVHATAGEVLMSGEEVCDARFSKCCGGVVESYENVWEEEKKPYLVPLYDDEKEELSQMDLRNEVEAEDFIRANASGFCNTKDAKILAEVLNDYDRETPDFFRWEMHYTQEELSELIKKRSGIDYGTVVDLQALARGYSGRIIRLKIVGTKRTRIIGKELEIRKTLSSSHLYSSAFVVERSGTDFILKGAGWGHGVGLCQIGAAVMGAKGYDYREILLHYFKNVEIKKKY